MIDNIEPTTFLVIMALIVAAWLIVGIREYRRTRRIRRALIERLKEYERRR